jgi:hypothetical protein
LVFSAINQHPGRARYKWDVLMMEPPTIGISKALVRSARLSSSRDTDRARLNATLGDSTAERGEFELPVPISEQSDDSIKLSFATS